MGTRSELQTDRGVKNMPRFETFQWQSGRRDLSGPIMCLCQPGEDPSEKGAGRSRRPLGLLVLEVRGPQRLNLRPMNPRMEAYFILQSQSVPGIT